MENMRTSTNSNDPDKEMARDDEQGPWVAVKQVCTICGNKHVSVHPVGMVRNGECPECHNFTCEDIEK